MNEHQCKGGNFWLGFFLGGLVGAFVLFLMGTKEGKKLLARFIEEAESYEEDLEEKVSNLQKKGEALLQEAQEVKNHVIENVEEGKKNISEMLISRLDQALTKIEDVQKQGATITEELHHRYFKKNGKTLAS